MMLSRTDRWQLALDLCNRMVNEYPVLLAGVYGSAARGTDTPWSDLEMLFVVEDESQAKGQSFVYRGIAAGYSVHRQNELENAISKPSRSWAFQMGVLSVLKTIHGDPTLIDRWLEMGKKVPKEHFHRYLEQVLPDLVIESHGRIHSCIERKSTDLRYAVIEVLFEMRDALCLLNKRWVIRDYDQGILAVNDFPKIPKDYAELSEGLLTSRNEQEIVELADRLVNNYWTLLESEGIKMLNYQAVEEIPY